MNHAHQILALRIALLYMVLSALWVLLSDYLLHFLVSDPTWHAIIATGKGWGFVLISAVLLFAVVNKTLRERERFNLALEAHARQQEAISTLRQHALAHTDPETLFTEAAMLVALTLDVEYSSIFVLSPDQQSLTLRAGVGWGAALPDAATIAASSDNLIGYTLQQTEPLKIDYLPGDPRFASQSFFGEYGIVSSITMTIVGQDQPSGVLGAHTDRQHCFTSDESRFLSAIASLLASVIQHHKAEHELSKQRILLESLFEISLDGILVTSPDMRIIAHNQRFADLTGVPAENLRNGSSRDAMQSVLDKIVDPEQFVARIQYLYAHRDEKSRDEIALKDGRILDRYSAPIADSSGIHYGRVWYYRDITEFRQAQATLREREMVLRSLIESMDDIVFTLDRQQQHTGVFGRWLERYGLKANDFLGKTARETAASEAEAAIHEAANARALAGEYVVYEWATGDPPTSVQTSLSPIYNPQGTVTGLVGVGRDITSIKQTEDELKQRNQQLAALNMVIETVSIYLHLPDVLETLKVLLAEHLHVAAGGIFLYHENNEDYLSLEKAWGMPPTLVETLTHLPVATAHNQHIVREQRPMLVRQIDEMPMPWHAVSDDSSPPWCCYLGVPLLAHGETQGVVDLFGAPGVPIHEDHIAFFATLGQQVGVAIQNARLFQQVMVGRERLQALSHRLVEVQEEERRHIARELHDEVGQILTGLNLTLELVARLPADQTYTRLEQAQQMVNDLILRVREMSLELRPPMLDDLGLQAALFWYFERYRDQTGIDVQFKHMALDQRFAPDIEVAVYRMVQEALTNVARHAMVPFVEVRLWANHEVLGVQIEDHGKGFDPEAALASYTSSGLSGMRERTSLLGGDLVIESAPGQGSCLTVEFPLTT
jgi:PAS domain S-box-containing protein